MSRRSQQITSLALIAALLNTLSVHAATTRTDLTADAAPVTGLRLDVATAHWWEAQFALRAAEPLAQAAETTGASPTAQAPDTIEEAEGTPFPWRTVPPDNPDLTGAARDTAYFMVFQLAVIGVLYVAPEAISNWTEEDKQTWNSDKWQENVSDPQRDTDDPIINYVLHPYWGATYYIRGRERGFTRPQSFLFSFGLSFLFEYGFEAVFENPSYQDLWVTPVIGSLIGEFWFSGVRERIKAKPGVLNWKDKTVLFLTDPLGVVSTATDRALGIDTKVTVMTFDTATAPPAAGHRPGTWSMSDRLLPTRSEPALGLQFQAWW